MSEIFACTKSTIHNNRWLFIPIRSHVRRKSSSEHGFIISQTRDYPPAVDLTPKSPTPAVSQPCLLSPGHFSPSSSQIEVPAFHHLEREPLSKDPGSVLEAVMSHAVSRVYLGPISLSECPTFLSRNRMKGCDVLSMGTHGTCDPAAIFPLSSGPHPTEGIAGTKTAFSAPPMTLFYESGISLSL